MFRWFAYKAAKCCLIWLPDLQFIANLLSIDFTAQQQQEGGGSLELAGLPGNHHRPMVKHRARFIHCCHCSRSMDGMLAFVKWRCKENYISSCLLMNELTRQASSKSFWCNKQTAKVPWPFPFALMPLRWLIKWGCNTSRILD